MRDDDIIKPLVVSPIIEFHYCPQLLVEISIFSCKRFSKRPMQDIFLQHCSIAGNPLEL